MSQSDQNKINCIKKELIANYAYLALGMILLNALLYYFFLANKLFAYCTFGYFISFLFIWLLVRKIYNIEEIVHVHIMTGTSLIFFMMLNIWKYSVVGCVWFLPVPLAAYIFFNKKLFFLYTAYIIVLILLLMFLHERINLNYLQFTNKNALGVSDSLAFITNIFVFALLIYYKDKIRKIEIEDQVLSLKPEESSTRPVKDDTEKYNLLFAEIKRLVEDECYFEKVDFNATKLSSLLNTNGMYISKAIKKNGYESFVHYLNVCRVNKVKELFMSEDMNKVTLLYIYTAAGFSNQSTFNRVFKSIEGITPTDYIKKNNTTPAIS